MQRFYATLLLSSALALGGCVPVVAGVAAPMIIQQKHVNLTNASYAAADTIAQQSGKRLPLDRPLIVSNLQEILHEGEARPPIANVDDVIDRTRGKAHPSPKVGIVISEQMRTRFTQLGYNVVQSPVYQGGAAPADVTGTYEFLSGTMNVALKLTDRKTGRVITLYNYSLPMTYDIRKYMTGNANMLPPLF